MSSPDPFQFLEYDQKVEEFGFLSDPSGSALVRSGYAKTASFFGSLPGDQFCSIVFDRDHVSLPYVIAGMSNTRIDF